MTTQDKLQKLKRALDRLDSYPPVPSDDSAVFVDWDNCLYELVDGEEGPILTLGDLRDLVSGLCEPS